MSRKYISLYIRTCIAARVPKTVVIAHSTHEQVKLKTHIRTSKKYLRRRDACRHSRSHCFHSLHRVLWLVVACVDFALFPSSGDTQARRSTLKQTDLALCAYIRVNVSTHCFFFLVVSLCFYAHTYWFVHLLHTTLHMLLLIRFTATLGRGMMLCVHHMYQENVVAHTKYAVRAPC